MFVIKHECWSWAILKFSQMNMYSYSCSYDKAKDYDFDLKRLICIKTWNSTCNGVIFGLILQYNSNLDYHHRYIQINTMYAIREYRLNTVFLKMYYRPP